MNNLSQAFVEFYLSLHLYLVNVSNKPGILSLVKIEHLFILVAWIVFFELVHLFNEITEDQLVVYSEFDFFFDTVWVVNASLDIVRKRLFKISKLVLCFIILDQSSFKNVFKLLMLIVFIMWGVAALVN